MFIFYRRVVINRMPERNEINSFFKTYKYPAELQGRIEPFETLKKEGSYVQMMLKRIDDRLAIKKRNIDNSDDEHVDKCIKK